jgi:hypothetical protein
LPWQVSPALKALRERKLTKFIILALTPRVEYALDKLGYDYVRPEDYHTEEDVHNVGLQDLSTLDNLSEFIDTFLHENWQLLRIQGIFPAFSNRYYLKNLINSVSVRAFIMSRLLTELRPDKVLFFDTRREAAGRDLFFVRESIWSGVIPKAANSHELPVESLGGNTDPTVSNQYGGTRRFGIIGELKYFASKVPGHSIGQALRRELNKFGKTSHQPSLSRGISTPSSLPTIINLGKGYSLGHLLREIEAENSFDIVHWDARSDLNLDHQEEPIDGTPNTSRPSVQELQETSSRLWSQIKGLPQFHRFSKFCEIDCYPLIENRLQRFFETDIPEMVLTHFQARTLFKSLNPVAILESVMGDYSKHVVCLAAKKEGVPFVLYQHGSGRGYVQMESYDRVRSSGGYPSVDLFPGGGEFDADYLMVFGEGDAELLTKCHHVTARVLPVGSAALDHLKEPGALSNRTGLMHKYGLDPKKRTVMYVPHAIDGNIRPAPFRSRSPSVLYEIQRQIVDVFADFPEIQLVVKLHPSHLDPRSPVVDLIKDRRLKNCVAVIEPFTSLLPIADLFIGDHCSTAFLEMLTTDRPVLFCGHLLPSPWAPGKWHPSLLEMWKERVAYSDQMDAFLESLRSYLREDRFQPVESNNTLLKLFGTHLDDGKSVQRAHDFLKSLAFKSQKVNVA